MLILSFVEVLSTLTDKMVELDEAGQKYKLGTLLVVNEFIPYPLLSLFFLTKSIYSY